VRDHRAGPRAAGGGAAHGAVLSRGGRRRRRAHRLPGREHQGQRVPVPPGRPAGRGRRAPAGHGRRAPAGMEQAPRIGFGRYIISATTPFTQDDLAELRTAAPDVVRRHFARPGVGLPAGQPGSGSRGAR
jgi:hypothetical protein